MVADVYVLKDRTTYHVIFEGYIISSFFDKLVICLLTAAISSVLLYGNPTRYCYYIYVAVLITYSSGIILTIFSGNELFIIDFFALSSIPILIVYEILVLFASRKKVRNNNEKILHGALSLSINYFSIIIIVLALFALVGIITNSFSPIKFEEGNDPDTAYYVSNIWNYSYGLFSLLSRISPLVIFVLISSFPIKIIQREIRQAFKNRKKAQQQHNNKHKPSSPPTYYDNNSNEEDARQKGSIHLWPIGSSKNSSTIVVLSLIVVLSVGIGAIPYFKALDSNSEVGVDTPAYVEWIELITNSSSGPERDVFSMLFLSPFSAERPLALLIIYGMAQILNVEDYSSFVESLPIVLGPLLVIVVFFLTRELNAKGSDGRLPLYSAFMTAVSFQVTIGIYGGFYANWIALIFGFLTLTLLLRYLKANKKRDLVFFTISSFMILLSHVYTWTVFSMVIVIFLIVLFLLRRKRKNEVHFDMPLRYSSLSILILILIISMPIFVQVYRTIEIGSSTGVLQDFAKAESGLNSENFGNRWPTLNWVSNVHLAGLYGNIIILGLGLIWLYYLKFNRVSSLLMVVFLSIGIVPIYFGDIITQARILYDIPFQLPAALGLLYLSNKHGKNGTSLVVPAICIWLIVTSVGLITNFVE